MDLGCKPKRRPRLELCKLLICHNKLSLYRVRKISLHRVRENHHPRGQGGNLALISAFIFAETLALRDPFRGDSYGSCQHERTPQRLEAYFYAFRTKCWRGWPSPRISESKAMQL